MMKLKEWLEREKIPTTNLAAQLDVHVNHLYQIIAGKRYPGYQLAKAIEEYTRGEVTADEIMKKKESLPKCPCCGRTMWKAKKDIGFNG